MVRQRRSTDERTLVLLAPKRNVSFFTGKKGPLHWMSWPLWKNLPIQTYSAHIKAMIPPNLSPLVFTFCLIFQCSCIPSFNMNLCRFEDFHLGHHTVWNILYKDRKLCKNKNNGKKGSVFLFNKPSFSHVVQITTLIWVILLHIYRK